MKDIEFGHVQLKLNRIMDANNISVSKLAYRSEMQRTQLKAYRDNKVARVDLAVLARLCYALDCKLEDLMEYMPPKKTEPPDSS